MSAKHSKTALSLFFCTSLFLSCQEKKSEVQNGITSGSTSQVSELPYFGEDDIELIRSEDGAVVADSVHYTIPKFSLTNQFGRIVSPHDYENKIFIVDFFFTECPSICTIMSSQIARLQEMMISDQLNKYRMII